MKEQIIQLPDNLEVKEIKDNKIILIEKEKKLTYDYDYVANKLFPDGEMHFYIDSGGCINRIVNVEFNCTYKNNANSKKQLKKLLAINMLMNVAKYLNDGWQPNWNDTKEAKYYIVISDYGNQIHRNTISNNSIVYFKSEELANKAIEILGEETIKLALCTDY